MDQPGILVSLKHSHLSQKHSHAKKSCLLSLQDRWTHTQPPLEKRTRFKTNDYISTPMCVLYVATYVQLCFQQCESMCVEFYAKKQWGRTQVFTCYMSPAQRHLQLMGAITASRGLQKSESLRAGLRYCCCGLGDNYLMNKLPKPLAKHTSYST